MLRRLAAEREPEGRTLVALPEIETRCKPVETVKKTVEELLARGIVASRQPVVGEQPVVGGQRTEGLGIGMRGASYEIELELAGSLAQLTAEQQLDYITEYIAFPHISLMLLVYPTKRQHASRRTHGAHGNDGREAETRGSRQQQATAGAD